MTTRLGMWGEQTGTGPAMNLGFRTVAGASAGDLVVTGIKPGDRLLAVVAVSTTGANLASEFTITDVDKINNTGGTSTSGVTAVLVVWQIAEPGMQS